MKVVYAERARQDIDDIYTSIAFTNPAAAQRVEDLIRRTCESLSDFPFASVATDEPNVRRAPLVRYPYTIFYRVDPPLDRVERSRVSSTALVCETFESYQTTMRACTEDRVGGGSVSSLAITPGRRATTLTHWRRRSDRPSMAADVSNGRPRRPEPGWSHAEADR